MFENLSERLSGVFDRLTKQGALSEDDVKTALREVRVALLEADVSLGIARDFVTAVQEKATGQSVTKSVTPGQQVVKIVHDERVHVLAGSEDPGALKIDSAPAPILMVGLQGSGKTTGPKSKGLSPCPISRSPPIPVVKFKITSVPLDLTLSTTSLYNSNLLLGVPSSSRT